MHVGHAFEELPAKALHSGQLDRSSIAGEDEFVQRVFHEIHDHDEVVGHDA